MQARTDGEMMERILSFAKEDQRVRAVWMNGSRANPNAPKDRWQDFDIVYAVTDMPSFLESDGWLGCFGERVMMQSRRDQFDAYADGVPDFSGWFIYLMQFADGTRIDLSLVPAENAAREVLADKMCVPLLDKDGLLPEIPPATDADYRVPPPSALEFHCCVNEFRWIFCGNVAKSVARGELSTAQEMLGRYLRKELLKMLSWKASVLHGPVNPGKHGKFLPRFLPKEDWAEFLGTYAGGDFTAFRSALSAAWRLFSRVSGEVAEALSLPLDREEEARVLRYLREAGCL